MARLILYNHGTFNRLSEDDYPSDFMTIREWGIIPQSGDFYSVDLSSNSGRERLVELGLALGPRDNTNTRKGFCKII